LHGHASCKMVDCPARVRREPSAQHPGAHWGWARPPGLFRVESRTLEIPRRAPRESPPTLVASGGGRKRPLLQHNIGPRGPRVNVTRGADGGQVRCGAQPWRRIGIPSPRLRHIRDGVQSARRHPIMGLVFRTDSRSGLNPRNFGLSGGSRASRIQAGDVCCPR